jgi:leucyl-tRNA synthetase
LSDNYIKILKVIFPVLPHFASECLNDLNIDEIKWPVVNKDYLKNSNYKIVVQINGKKRLLFEDNENLDEANLIKKLREIKEIKKYIEKKDIYKTIFIKNKLINLIIK